MSNMSNNMLNRELAGFSQLLDLFDSFTSPASAASDSLAYLSRGERIINTLRQKQSRSVRAFSEDDFLEIIDYRKYACLNDNFSKLEYVLKRIRDCILRPAAKAYVPFSVADDGTITHEDNTAWETVMKRMPLFAVTKVIQDSSEWALIRSITPAPSRKYLSAIYEITWCKTDPHDNTSLCVPFPEECHPTPSKNLASYRFRHGNDWYRSADFATSFAYIYLVCEIKRLFDKETETIQADGDRSYDDSTICCFIKAELQKIREAHSRYGFLYVYKDAMKYPFIREFAKSGGGQFVEIDSRKGCPEGVRALELSHCFIPWLVYGSVMDIPVKIEYVYRNYNRLAPAFCYSTENLIIRLLDLLTDEYTEDRRAYVMRENAASEHARSFENLKGLSDRHVADMASSGFNDYFGYVEFDPDVLKKGNEIAYEVLNENGDVTGVETIISEFKAIADIFSFTKKENVSLRFRKLGNHHASGLYYPGLKCLCVDIRVPSSFIHEYGHMLDTEALNASRSEGFFKIRQKYGYLIRRAANNDKQLGRRLKKGKYSIEYYLTATEIFARTFEMYMSRCCGISNSLIQPSDQESFAYPHDAELEELIREYFDIFLHFNSSELFGKLHPELPEVEEKIS